MEPFEVRATEILKRFPGVGTLLGVEVGVATGLTSQALLAKHPRLHLAMVDSWADKDDQPPTYLASGDWHATCTEAEQLAHMREAENCTAFARERRKIIRATSLTASQYFEAKSLDFVFIDGDHSYEGCRDDIAAWKGKVRLEGYLCGHDYGHTPQQDRPWTTGVKKAVDEAVAEHGWTLELGSNFCWFVRI